MASAARSGQAAGGDGFRRDTRVTSGFTLILTLLFWAVAMQKRLPFSPGQRLGLGFLIGGVTGVLAQLISGRLARMTPAESSDRQTQLASHSVAFLALFGASLTYSLFHGDPQTALIGFSVGAVMAGILYYYSQDSDSASARYAETWAILGITLAMGVWLSVAHFNNDAQRMWWPLPILIGSTVLIASYVAAELRSLVKLQSNPRLGAILPGLVLVVIILGLSAIYSWRLFHDWALFGVVAVGIVIAGITAWLGSRLSAAQDGSAGLDVASGVVLLTVAFAVAAFKLWSGLGIVLGLLAAWPVALLQSGTGDAADKKSRALSGFLALGLVILLFRLFVERYRIEVGTADLRIHYTFIGALLGAILPFTFISTLARMRAADEPGARPVAQVAFIGLIAALSPVLLFLVWDIKVVLGFVFGLSAGMAFLIMSSLSGDESLLSRKSIALLAIGSELAAIVFTGPLVQFELTRAVRISVLGGIVLIAAVWLMLTGIRSARRSR